MNPTPIPLFSAAAAQAGLDLLPIMQRVLDSHWYILGQELKGFEQTFADYTGVADCIGVANGTDALELALRAAGVQAGDQVVTVANAGFYSSTAILAIGAVPLYVDIDPDRRTMSAAALRSALPERPAAIVVTHLYGQMADMDALCSTASAAGIPLIEDCAQAHGALWQGRRAGSLGALGCFSFYPTKNLGALGDGGAVTTNDATLAARVRQLRQYGWGQKYSVETAGGRNSRLDELQAAILAAKLPLLDSHNARRRALAARYNQAFQDLPLRCPPSVGPDYVAHLYVVATPQRDALAAWLAQHGVATAVHYPIADHRQLVMDGSAAIPGGPLIAGELSHTDKLVKQILTLPCFVGLDDRQQDRVISLIRAFFKAGRE